MRPIPTRASAAVSERPEVGHVGFRSATLLRGENEMRLDVTDDTEFGKAMINNGFPRTPDVSSTPHEVAAGGSRFQPGGVDRGPRERVACGPCVLDRRVEQAPGRRGGEQTSRRFLQRRVVRNRAELQRLKQRRTIGQMSHHAPIVGLQKALQHQTGKELMLRELLRAVAMRVERQRPLGSRQRRQQHCARRLARSCHAFLTNAGDTTV